MGRKIEFLLLATVAITFKVSSAADYCKIQSCGNNPHTCCTYPSAGPGKTCKDVISTGISKEEQDAIVKYHNQLRQKVASGKETQGSPGPQPGAKNMPDLKWNDELALIAQRWADQCNFSHDPCRNTENSVVGQNIAYMGTTGDVKGIKYEQLVQNWYDEVKDMPNNGVSKYSGSGANNAVVGHYTQVVWSKSTEVGCGAISFKDGNFNKVHLICNYSPAGNFLNEPVYDIA